MSDRALYLAYGSNLHGPRLRARAPSARCVGTVALSGWDLRFHKRGWVDGSGKCDIVPDPVSTVHCAVYRLGVNDRPALDAAEGLGNGYAELRLRVPPGDGDEPVFTYVAQPSHIDPSRAPYDWYLDLVVAGARQRGFPAGYVERLERTPTIADPDRERALFERRVLAPS